jgi:hypothetical protein
MPVDDDSLDALVVSDVLDSLLPCVTSVLDDDSSEAALVEVSAAVVDIEVVALVVCVTLDVVDVVGSPLELPVSSADALAAVSSPGHPVTRPIGASKAANPQIDRELRCMARASSTRSRDAMARPPIKRARECASRSCNDAHVVALSVRSGRGGRQ